MSESNGHGKLIVENARRLIAGGALIIDTETTGLGEDDKALEIAIVDAAGTFEFSSLIKPTCHISEAAARVHGITAEVAGAGMDAEALWPIVHLIICGSPLLAYNAAFDSRIIVQTFGPEARDHEWHCLMNAWMEFHGLERWARLENVCHNIGVDAGGHRALGDAKAAREVLYWLAKQEG